MNTTRLTRTLSTALLLFFVGTPFLVREGAAQEEAPSAEMMEMMEAWQKAGMPTEHHEALAAMAGTWETEFKMWMDPSAPPMTSTSTVESEMVMGGRFYKEEVKGDFMGQTFHGVALIGYNNLTEEFEGLWYDNMSTSLYRYTGSMDGNELELHGKFMDPMSGEWIETRSVRTIISDDEMTEVGYEIRDGQERKTMETTYKRKKM